ncbi:MAG: ATP-binding cassette domain-containing protein [Desulfobacterales bacterium]
MTIELRKITFKFPTAERNVFDDLSLKLSEPGFHALFGPSGVGKTTLARILSGDIEADSGEVSTVHISPLLYSYNLERLPGWSSVGTHLEKIIQPRQKTKKDEIINDFGVAKCMASRFSQLSLGQQNRVNLARYLLQDFELLIMDESLANVDELTRGQIILKIKKMFPQAYFLYISHNVIEVSKYCRHIFVLRSCAKNPQIIKVNGQDYQGVKDLRQEDLDKTMLEIMNAS